jgi:hypothetical protein
MDHRRDQNESLRIKRKKPLNLVSYNSGYLRISTHIASLYAHFWELLKLLLQFGLLISQPGVFMENTIAVPDDMIQLIKELAIGTAEVDNLGPQLTQLLLPSHS